jgi:peptidoglycan-associated lipoprotein
MKRFLQFGLISLLVAASLGGAGCKRNPKNITAIPAPEGRGGTTTDLVPSQPITTTPSNPGFNSGGNSGRPINPGTAFNPNAGNPNPVDLNPTPVPNPGDPGNLDPRALPTDSLRGDGTQEDRETLRGSTVYFEFDKSAVKKGAETAKAIVVAEYLKAHPDQKLEIEGHADERGTEGYNLALGERRALSVREILLNNGVGADRVTTVSYGEARPADVGHDEAAWQKNRRSEFILLLPAGAKVR